MSVLCLLMAIAGFALFGLATPEHHAALLGRPMPPSRARVMRRAAWVMIALALPFAILARGWVVGPILWAGSLILGAGLVFLALNLLPLRPPRPTRK